MRLVSLILVLGFVLLPCLSNATTCKKFTTLTEREQLRQVMGWVEGVAYVSAEISRMMGEASEPGFVAEPPADVVVGLNKNQRNYIEALPVITMVEANLQIMKLFDAASIGFEASFWRIVARCNDTSNADKQAIDLYLSD